MSDFVIEARKVTKTLGRGAREVQALRGIDLSLKRGELTLLMGPSGSGKTTLLLILGCMLTPSSGTLTVCGTSVAMPSIAPMRLRSLRSISDGSSNHFTYFGTTQRSVEVWSIMLVTM